ncbi:MAG: YlmC/YmxH family sporulation protein, partial [Bacillota bacterium]|nr:YlmC/YmxH family sporulation protein [Bacillota bacterium]
MRLSEAGYKEIVDLSDGSRYGDLAGAEFLMDENTGRIKAILIPGYRGRMAFLGGNDTVSIPWEAVR